MDLNSESVNAYKTILSDPAKYEFDFKPIHECFEKSDRVTAKHILAKEYMDYIQKPIAKVFVYIIMDEIFGLCDGKDDHGNLGYHLKFKLA